MSSGYDVMCSCECLSDVDGLKQQILTMQKTIITLGEKLVEFEKRFEDIELNSSERKSSIPFVVKMRPLIKEKLYKNKDEKVDTGYVKDKLENGTVKSDFLVIKRIYFRGLHRNQIPIRVYKKGYLEYWANDKWNVDKNGSKTLSILIGNLKAYYKNVNKADVYIDDPNVFIKNQTHIHEMKGAKYRNELYRMIIEYFEDF